MDETSRSLVRRGLHAAPWVVAPAAGAAWAMAHLWHTYFFFDEWSMVDRVLHVRANEATMASFNGHLWMLQYWVYRIQVSWFGLGSHAFVSAVFIVALVALHVGIAALLRGAGVGVVVSLLAGGLLTYLGVASQSFIFAVQLSPTLSLVAGLVAAALVQARPVARPPTIGRCFLVGALTSASVGLDSGVALTAVALVATVVLWHWRGWRRLTVVPAVALLVLWYLAGDLGPRYSATLGARARFASHLLLRAAGGLSGRGEVAGILALGVLGAVVGVGLRRRLIVGAPAGLLCAGAVATAAVVGSLAFSRAGLPGFNYVDFNRYLQSVAAPLTIGALPAVHQTLLGLFGERSVLAGVRPGSSDRIRAAPTSSVRDVPSRRLEPFPTTARVASVLGSSIVLAFVLGLAPTRRYSDTFVEWNVLVRRRVQSAVDVMIAGCPAQTTLDMLAKPAGDLSPQVTVGLLGELIAQGALHRSATIERHDDMAALICRATP